MWGLKLKCLMKKQDLHSGVKWGTQNCITLHILNFEFGSERSFYLCNIIKTSNEYRLAT